MLRNTPWTLYKSDGSSRPLPDLNAIGPINASGTWLALPPDLDPYSTDFQRGMRPYAQPDSAIQFILDNPAYNFWKVDERGLSHIDNFLIKTEKYRQDRPDRIHNLIDGFSVVNILSSFESRWKQLEDGDDPVQQLTSEVVPRFQDLQLKLERYNTFIADVEPDIFFAELVARRLRYWMYQELILIREDLRVHSMHNCERRLALYRDGNLNWQACWRGTILGELVQRHTRKTAT